MDQIGKLELAWSQGYEGQELCYIKNDICYLIGRNVTVLNENGTQKVFQFSGKAVGPFAVHTINETFALGEHCIDPKIYIYSYPDFEERNILIGGAKMTYRELKFSASNYLVSLSGVPDFKLVLWNYMMGEKLASVTLAPEPPTSVAFNPANWRQICVTTKSSITVWNAEMGCTACTFLPHKVQLPPEDESLYPEDKAEKECSSAGMASHGVTVPHTAIAGLIGEKADNLHDIQDATVRVTPVAQAWMPSGDIFVGGSKGHLLKVDGESYKVWPLLYPRSSEDDSDGLTAGSLNCLALHQAGLFAAGKDGILRLLDVHGDSVQVVSTYSLDTPVSSLAFSYNYLNIAIGSPGGSIHLMPVSETRTLQVLIDISCGKFVGVGVLAGNAHTCVSARANGLLQAWSVDEGLLVSSLSVGEPVSVMACSPLAHFVVAGSACGQLYFVDFTAVDEPRLVHRIRLYTGPCKRLVFDHSGMFLFTGGDDKYVFVLDGKPTSLFCPLGYTDVGGEVKAISTLRNDTGVQVMVAVHSRRTCDRTSDNVVSFFIADSLIQDLENSYKSIKNDFKDEAIHKTRYVLKPPSVGIALGRGNKTYTIDRADHCIQTLNLCEAASQPDESTDLQSDISIHLLVDYNGEGHQLQGKGVLLSPHLHWLASYGCDGVLLLRTTDDMDCTVAIQTHDHRTGGVYCVAFAEDCQSVFTTGHDGVLCCSKWNLGQGGLPEDVIAEIDRSLSDRRQFIQELIDCQDEALRGMVAWQQPPHSPRDIATVKKETKLQEHADKRKAIEKGEIYRTPTPEPHANCTWLEEKEYQVLMEETKLFEDTKKTLRKHVREIRKTIKKMMKENQGLSDLEKLGHQEFELNTEEQARLQVQGEVEIEKLREESECENMSNAHLRDRIKHECWDSMYVKGRSLKKPRSQQVIRTLEKITARRMIEMRELEIRKKEVDVSAKQRDEVDETSADEDDELLTRKEHLSLTGSLGSRYGGDSDALYSQFHLHLRQHKIQQIALLQDAVHRIKEVFNLEFDQVYLKKEQEIFKIKEKNKRIAKIYRDLDMEECVVEPKLSVFERPELLFTVQDHEIKSEKYLTPAQQKELDELAQLEEERRLAEMGDNQRERALQMMMGGVLEICREDELKKDVPIPAFMQQKEQIQWNEEERKLALEYERKVQALNEEREVFRKQLEAELNKLQEFVVESKASFDEALEELFQQKMKIVMVLNQEELKIRRLTHSLMVEDELTTWEVDVVRKLDQKKRQKMKANETLKKAQDCVHDLRTEYEMLVAEEKVLDKALKKEFNDVTPVMADHLVRLARKRPKVSKFKDPNTAVVHGKRLNPFAERPSTARQAAYAESIQNAGLAELDKTSHMPEGLDPSVWQRMCHCRHVKVLLENKVKQKAQALSEMQTFAQRCHSRDDSAKNELDDLYNQYYNLKAHQTKFCLDMEVQLLMKQGQVEVMPGEFVPDYSQSILIPRILVERHNNVIKEQGQKKIASMMESKQYRKCTIQLEWEHKKLSMQMEDLQNKLKDIRYLKVTRAIQDYLIEGDHVGKKAAEIATLEQTIALQNKHHQKTMAEKLQQMKDMEQSIRKRNKRNAVLTDGLTELNVVINERHNIDRSTEIRQRKEADTEHHYQDVLQRCKLVDVAKAQAQAMAVMEVQVEQLRNKVYPVLTRKQP